MARNLDQRQRPRPGRRRADQWARTLVDPLICFRPATYYLLLAPCFLLPAPLLAKTFLTSTSCLALLKRSCRINFRCHCRRRRRRVFKFSSDFGT